MLFLKLCTQTIAATLLAFALSFTAQAEQCETQKISKAMIPKLKGFNDRLLKNEDNIQLRSDLESALNEEPNCYEKLFIRTMILEAIAYSADPEEAIPALEIIYKRNLNEGPKLANFIDILGRQYAATGRNTKLQELINRHPNLYHRTLSKLQSGLTISLAQNGELASATEAAEQLLEMSSDDPRLYHYEIAIAVAEVAEDSDTAAGLAAVAERKFGQLHWPSEQLDDFETKFEFIYRQRFDPEFKDSSAAHIQHHDARPKRPPIVNYPNRAMQKGAQGNCEVHFDVSKNGKPINLDAYCTSDLFERESIKALSRVRFEPATYKGVPYTRYNVVYPIEFTISD